MTKATKLFNRNFVLLWQGQFVSQMGNQAFSIALMFWIKHETGSATLMGLIMMVSQIPAVILSPIAGAFADRHSRKSIIIVSDMVRGVTVLALAALIFFAPDESDMILAALFVVAIIASSMGAFFRPAISAAIPDLVPTERVAAANSMNQSSMQASMLAGQSVGGVLFRIMGAPLLFMIDGVTYLISAVSEMFISIPQKAPKPSTGSAFQRFKVDTIEGMRFAWKHPGRRSLTLAAAFINFFLVPFLILLPFYVEDTLGVTVDWYGFMIAALGLGSLIGYLGAGTIKVKGRTRSWMMIGSLILMSLAFAALGLTKSPPAAVVLMFLAGAVNGYININIATIMQLTTPSEIRGRVFGLLGTMSAGLTPISMGLTGFVTDLLDQNIPLVMISCGLITAILSIAVSFGREFRQFLTCDVEEATDENPGP
ncbi:MAG: MFS transporter [candidate division Zixibacteria bacterium]|nr:MFS transporter [candidate division Zixibacteria bacterium]MDH3938238.1 MFS transporter [candidate division Zixibacteria bacterium]MDH4034393.1 MFS transporter [candidate division Zixibacteria bacterium]